MTADWVAMSNFANRRAFFRFLIARLLNGSISRKEVAEWVAFEFPERPEMEPEELLGSCEWILRHANELSTTEQELRYYQQCLRGDRVFELSQRDNIRGSPAPILKARLGDCVWAELHRLAGYHGVVLVPTNPLLKPRLYDATRTSEFAEVLKWFFVRTTVLGERRCYWVCSTRLPRFLRELDLFFAMHLSDALA